MQTTTTEILSEVGREVLENMAFIFVTPGMETADEEPNYVCASVGFSGPYSGKVTVSMPYTAMRELANNLLGMETEGTPTEKEQLDAIGEFANVVCGNVLGVMAGPALVFDLDPPKLKKHDDEAEPVETTDDKGTVVKHPLENGWVEFAIILD